MQETNFNHINHSQYKDLSYNNLVLPLDGTCELLVVSLESEIIEYGYSDNFQVSKIDSLHGKRKRWFIDTVLLF